MSCVSKGEALIPEVKPSPARRVNPEAGSFPSEVECPKEAVEKVGSLDSEGVRVTGLHTGASRGSVSASRGIATAVWEFSATMADKHGEMCLSLTELGGPATIEARLLPTCGIVAARAKLVLPGN